MELIHSAVVTGEEDEETISTAKGKLYEFSPASKDWCEKGVGLMKLNKSRDEEMFRIGTFHLLFVS